MIRLQASFSLKPPVRLAQTGGQVAAVTDTGCYDTLLLRVTALATPVVLHVRGDPVFSRSC